MEIDAFAAAHQRQASRPLGRQLAGQLAHARHGQRRHDQVLALEQGEGIAAIAAAPALDPVAPVPPQVCQGAAPGTQTHDADPELAHGGIMRHQDRHSLAPHGPEALPAG